MEIDELYVLFRAQTGPAIEGITALTEAGERAAAVIDTSSSSIVGSTEAIGVSTRTTAVAMDEMAAQAQIGYERMVASSLAASQAMEGAAAQAAAALTALTEASDRAAAGIGASSTSVVASTDAIGLSTRTTTVAMDEMALKAQIDYERMAASSLAASQAMEGAAVRAAAANARVTASIVEGETAASTAAASSMKRYGLAALGLGIVAAATVHMAADFETSTTKLVTSAGETRAGLKIVQDGILQMTGEVGDSAEELAKAMYIIESGGQHGAKGLIVLRAAAEGAAAEGADLYEVADAVTSVLQDYHLKAEDAALVTSQMVAAVGSGKTTFQEFSSSLAAVLPKASAAHIAFSDIAGAIAGMTVHGMSAQQATQNLADVIQHLMAPTGVMTKELGQLGWSTADLSDKLGTRGLTGTLQDISKLILDHMGPSGRVLLNAFNQSKDAARDSTAMISAMPKALQDLAHGYQTGATTLKEWRTTLKGLPPEQANLLGQWAALENRAKGFNDVLKSGSPAAQTYMDAMRRATGDATGLNVALMLTGENTDYVNKAVAKVAGATTEAGNHVRGWAEIQDTFNNKMHRAGAALGALGIEIGERLLPVASRFFDVLATGAEWLSKHKVLATALATALGLMAYALTVAAAAQWVMNAAALANPYVWIAIVVIAAIVAIIAVIYELYTHWSAIWGWIKDVSIDVWHWLVKTWDSIAGAVSKFWKHDIIEPIRDAWNKVKEWTGDAVDFFQAIPGRVGAALKALPGMLADAGKAAMHDLFFAIGFGIGKVYLFFTELPHNIHKLYTAFWDGTVKYTKEGAAKVGHFFVELKDDVVDTVVSWWHNTTEFVRQGISDTIRYMRELPPRVIAYAEDMWHRAVNAAANMVNETVAWLAGLPERARRAIVELPGRIWSVFSDAGSWLYNAGRNIVTGAINGIRDMIGSAIDTVKGWGHDIVRGFNSAVGNSSPSKLFAESGRNIVAGLVQGIVGMRGTAIGAINDLAGDMVLAPSISVGIGAAAGAGAGATGGGAMLLGGGWRPPAPAPAGDNLAPIIVRAELHLDGKKVYDTLIPHAQQHKNRNTYTALS